MGASKRAIMFRSSDTSAGALPKFVHFSEIVPTTGGIVWKSIHTHSPVTDDKATYT
jgi:hypothetical protein